MRLRTFKFLLPALALAINCAAYSQITERERPAEWADLVPGGRFIDRFLSMQGSVLSSDTWGVEGVKPRFTDNGIEDATWSYWGGNIRQAGDGKYHMFVCGWLESSPRGHSTWPRSTVFNAVGDSLWGPYVIRDTIGKGHNPEMFVSKEGKYVVYVIDGRYTADDINGPWEYGKFDFNIRDRRVQQGYSNMTFARREDGSYLMVCRGGGVWISETGLSEYAQITDRSVYPQVEGRFEDPVVWRDHVQYHLIVNDWLGRIAYYQRSKDGVTWVTDPGEAYVPGISVHEDGLVEDWFKYERLKVYQDEYGRAVQANFAVIDTLKPLDRGSDIHSSKNITIPLNPGMLLTVLDKKPITGKTKTIRVRIRAEEGFDPQTDVDVSSLRFGASEEVNFGRGGKALKTRNKGRDLIVTFDAAASGITADEFAPKLLGRSAAGEMVYGYARLPYVDYVEPILSARAPEFSSSADGMSCVVEVQNFGQEASRKAFIKVEYNDGGERVTAASGEVPALEPYEKTTISLPVEAALVKDREYRFTITISSGGKELSKFEIGKKAL